MITKCDSLFSDPIKSNIMLTEIRDIFELINNTPTKHYKNQYAEYCKNNRRVISTTQSMITLLIGLDVTREYATEIAEYMDKKLHMILCKISHVKSVIYYRNSHDPCFNWLTEYHGERIENILRHKNPFITYDIPKDISIIQYFSDGDANITKKMNLIIVSNAIAYTNLELLTLLTMNPYLYIDFITI